MLSMELARSSGQIEILNTPIDNINLQSEGKHIGMCPQHNAIYP